MALRDLNMTVTELLAQNMSIRELFSMGFSAAELLDAGVSCGEVSRFRADTCEPLPKVPVFWPWAVLFVGILGSLVWSGHRYKVEASAARDAVDQACDATRAGDTPTFKPADVDETLYSIPSETDESEL
jgi:hypothetical protein